LDIEREKLKQTRKDTVHYIAVKSLPEEDRFTRLRTERKHSIDTIKMIAYRTETSLASLLREHLARTSDDARLLRRQVFEIAADLIPDFAANILTVRLHHFTQAAHDQAIEKLGRWPMNRWLALLAVDSRRAHHSATGPSVLRLRSGFRLATSDGSNGRYCSAAHFCPDLEHRYDLYCTVKAAEPVVPPEFAPMVVVPVALQFANPAALGPLAMVATDADEELQ
jgi:hypothetical protein